MFEAEKEMLFRRTCLLVDYEQSNRNLDKAKANKRDAVSVYDWLAKVLLITLILQITSCAACCFNYKNKVSRNLEIIVLSYFWFDVIILYLDDLQLLN